MALLSSQTSQKFRRRRLRIRRLVSKLLGLVLVLGVIAGAVILAAQLRDEHPGSVQSRPAEIDGTRKISLEAIQDELEALDWVAQDLLPVNDYSRPGTALKKVNAIVVHYVGNAGTTAAQNRSYYSRLAENRETSASSNFLIGMEGEVLACVPVNEVAYCSNWRNDDTISIECCHPDESGKFTDDTYESLVKLTAWLCSALALDSGDIIRHYDVTGKECPKYFVDHEDKWDAFKDDVQDALDNLKAQPEQKDSAA